MAKRASPGVGRAGVGHNSGMPAHQDVRTALAIELVFADQIKELTEKRKRARKKIEGMGIPLAALDRMKRLDGMTAAEIEQQFKLDFHMMGAIHGDLYEQYDIFAPKREAPERRAAYYQTGLNAGMHGQDFAPPPGLAGDALQQMTDGFNEGKARRAAASEAVTNEAYEAAMTGSGKVVDGTPSAVSARAAADFAADQKAEGKGDPLVVDGVKYDTMRQANAARKKHAPVVTATTEAEANATVAAMAAADPLDEAIRLQREMQSGAPAKNPPSVPLPPADDGPSVVGVSDVRPDDADAGEAAGSFAADLAETQPKRQLPMPNWDHYDDDPDNWFAVQKAEARRWAESLPAAYVPLTTHVGAGAFLRVFWAEQKAAAPVEHDTADAPGNHQPPAQSSVEEVDYDAVEADAERLRKSAFMAGDSKAAASAEAQKRKAHALKPRARKAVDA